MLDPNETPESAGEGQAPPEPKPWEEMTPEEVADAATDLARHCLEAAQEHVEEGQEVVCTAWVIGPEGTQVMLMPFRGETEKEAASAVLREQSRQQQAQAAVFISNAYGAEGPDPDDPDGTRFGRIRRPRERSDYYELLTAEVYMPDRIVHLDRRYHREPPGIRWEAERQVTLMRGDCETNPHSRFDPWGAPDTEPTLDEIGFHHGMAVKLVPFDGEHAPDFAAGTQLTSESALRAGQIIRELIERVLQDEAGIPPQEPWQA